MLEVEAQIVNHETNKKRQTCEGCSYCSYTAREYYLLHKAEKLVYFKFNTPNKKRKVTLCQDCFFKQLKTYSKESQKEIGVRVHDTDGIFFLQVSGNVVNPSDDDFNPSDGGFDF